MNKYRNTFFLAFILAIFALGMFTFIKEPVIKSDIENRNLNTFEAFRVEAFLNGKYQDNLEKALSDQFIESEQIKSTYMQVIARLSSFGVKDICHNRYIELKDDKERKRGIFDCEDYIIYLPLKLNDKQKEIISNNIKKYNKVNQLTNAYYYFVDDPTSFDFRENRRVVDYMAILNSMKGQKGVRRLEYNSFEEYKKYFYKTDHHWDYRGQYQGTLDILDMLGIKNNLKPSGIFTNHEDSFGSYARLTNNYDYPEEFKYYKYDIPKHKTMINGQEKAYSHYDAYEKHDYEYNKTTAYYSYVYGNDFAEIEFDFYQPRKENLLIIANSYSNPINELIAQYFDKTYVIDLRHYKEEYGKDFKLDEYLNEKKIDKTLFIMSPPFIWSEGTNQGLEE